MANTRALQKIRKLKQATLDAVRHGAIMYANGKGGRPIVDQHFTEGNQQRYGWQPLSREYFMWKQGLLKPQSNALSQKAHAAINSVRRNRSGLRALLTKHSKSAHKSGKQETNLKLAKEIDAFDLETKRLVHEVTKSVTPVLKPRSVTAAKGSKLDKNAGWHGMSKHADKHTGSRHIAGHGKNLPMLVLTGELRAKVNSKGHTVAMRGGDAVITFRQLPEYAVYHHEGGPKLPIRSPVKPNELDKVAVVEYMRAYMKRATGVELQINALS